MFKQITTVYLLLILMVQAFNKVVIVAGYYANTAAYAENCVNKAAPQMHCHGKCQMMKQLKQEENRDRQNSERRGSIDEFIAAARIFCIVPSVARPVVVHYSLYTSIFPAERGAAIFHPPGA